MTISNKQRKPIRKAAKPDMKGYAWHAIPVGQVLQLWETSDKGLASWQVEKRREIFGENRLPEPKSIGPVMRFMLQFHNVLIYVLISAGVVTALLGHWIDASVIFGVVVLNAIIGFVQEGKAEEALKAIKNMLSPAAMVVRGGKKQTIPAEDLVPGDLVMLQSGDKVPADLRLVRVNGLQAQEAVLTGESLAVEKSITEVPEIAVIGDQLDMAFSGTLVSHGQANGVVVATGADTEIGRISRLVSEVDAVSTPLLRQMAQFGRWLTIAILGLALLTFLFGTLIRDYGLSEMFLAAVSLAVAAIPEGLPAIMTITLAIGVQQMAKRNAIIRRLPAVETLGAVSVICSDKTGTLTRNEMTVKEIRTANEIFTLQGTGYDPHGGVLDQHQQLVGAEHPVLNELSRSALLCNDAELELKKGEWQVVGDPMEAALRVAGIKAGLDADFEHKAWPRTDLIPFESEHRFMATLHHSHTGEACIFIKGAPERILDMCSMQQGIKGTEKLDKSCWLHAIESMADNGERVLAIAKKSVNKDHLEMNFSDVENGLEMLGLFGLIDPPREEAIEAVQICSNAGIRVKMITGDHAATASAIARQLKLVNPDAVISGEALEQLSDEQLLKQVEDVDVYARVSPEHKLRLVRLLQSRNLIIAMTGDGVNDAPALKRADVGTAMGMNGTEAAKEAAEMVLADDNFASIAAAVEEGRTVYDNLKKAILFILPTNGGEALVILAAIVLGFQQLPLTPVQILWVNMITAVTLALSLAFEPPEDNVMQRQPRLASEPLLSHHLVWRILFVAMILMVGTFGLFMIEVQRGASVELARTVAVNTLVMFEIFYLFNSRYILEPVINIRGLFGSRYVLGAIALLILFQLGFTYLPVLQELFGTASLSVGQWLMILLVSSSVLFLVELEKYYLRKKQPLKKRPWKEM